VAMIEFWRILSWEDFVLYLCSSMVSLMIYGILEYFFPGEDFVPEEDLVLYLCNFMFSLTIYGILEYFFPGEDFDPEEDFVLCIFSPLLVTFSCGNDCIL
jgi:hypothetical protein